MASSVLVVCFSFLKNSNYLSTFIFTGEHSYLHTCKENLTLLFSQNPEGRAIYEAFTKLSTGDIG